MSIVRNNLMTVKGYAPYCGEFEKQCLQKVTERCEFDGEQFVCQSCGWRSSFDAEFIREYKAAWNID
jgi:hypothetical protein